MFTVRLSDLRARAAALVSVSEQARPGPAGSYSEALAQPPPPPPPPQAQRSPGPVQVGVVSNRRPGSVRSAPMSPPGRRPRLWSSGTSRSPPEAREELRRRLLDLIEGNRVMIFSKSYCPHSTRVGGAGAVGAEAAGGGGVSLRRSGLRAAFSALSEGRLGIFSLGWRLEARAGSFCSVPSASVER